MRRQDSNLRPPGYELLKSVFSVAALWIFALFQGKPGGRSPLRAILSTLCYPRMGQRMGQTDTCHIASLDFGNFICRHIIITLIGFFEFFSKLYKSLECFCNIHPSNSILFRIQQSLDHFLQFFKVCYCHLNIFSR